MRFILDNSLLLLAGTLTAVIWANLDLSSYENIAHYLHFAANDVGMVFFFALAAKEVFEATLPGGPLASPRQALSPLAAAVGGMAMPALIFVALVSSSGPAELVGGWAIPCATDIAFSAMIARLIFPAAHPAIPTTPDETPAPARHPCAGRTNELAFRWRLTRPSANDQRSP